MNFRYYLLFIIITLNLRLCSSCQVKKRIAICTGDFTLPEEKDIIKIIIQSTSLKTIAKNFLKDYTKLEEVDFSNSDIKTLEPEAFIYLENLRSLIFAHNRNLEIPKTGPFLKIWSLKKLSLRDVGLTELRQDSFKELPNLNIIEIGNNPIVQHFRRGTTVPKDILDVLKHYKTVIFMKDDSVDVNDACKHLGVDKTILLKTNNDNSDAYDEFSCELLANFGIKRTFGGSSTENIKSERKPMGGKKLVNGVEINDDELSRSYADSYSGSRSDDDEKTSSNVPNNFQKTYVLCLIIIMIFMILIIFLVIIVIVLIIICLIHCRIFYKKEFLEPSADSEDGI